MRGDEVNKVEGSGTKKTGEGEGPEVARVRRFKYDARKRELEPEQSEEGGRWAIVVMQSVLSVEGVN